MIPSVDAPNLILLRHGESEWNAADVFAGWVDVPLTEVGRREARAAGVRLAGAGLLPGVVHTSVLRRAVDTAALALDAGDRPWVPVRRSWRLNERHYGALQGRPKSEILERYGEVQFARWRRGSDAAPPPIEDHDPWSQAGDARYADGPAERVRSESLLDVRRRLLPYWYCAVGPDLRLGRTVWVVAHGNALRVLVAHLEGLDDATTAALEIATGVPLGYRIDGLVPPVIRPARARQSGRCGSGAGRL